jgi:hypothetical protein
MSKYLEYPRRVCGKSPDTSAAAYLSLARLVTLRNQLVHFTSRPFNINELDKASDFHSELNAHLRAGVDDAIETVDLVLTEIGTLEGVSHSLLSASNGLWARYNMAFADHRTIASDS